MVSFTKLSRCGTIRTSTSWWAARAQKEIGGHIARQSALERVLPNDTWLAWKLYVQSIFYRGEILQFDWPHLGFIINQQGLYHTGWARENSRSRIFCKLVRLFACEVAEPEGFLEQVDWTPCKSPTVFCWPHSWWASRRKLASCWKAPRSILSKRQKVKVTLLNGHDGDKHFEVKKSVIYDPFLFFVIVRTDRSCMKPWKTIVKTSTATSVCLWTLRCCNRRTTLYVIITPLLEMTGEFLLWEGRSVLR